MAVSNPIGWALTGAASVAIVIYVVNRIYIYLHNKREHEKWQEVITGEGEYYQQLYNETRKNVSLSLEQSSESEIESDIGGKIVAIATKKLIELGNPEQIAKFLVDRLRNETGQLSELKELDRDEPTARFLREFECFTEADIDSLATSDPLNDAKAVELILKKLHIAEA
jgi:hypothetical protein